MMSLSILFPVLRGHDLLRMKFADHADAIGKMTVQQMLQGKKLYGALARMYTKSIVIM